MFIDVELLVMEYIGIWCLVLVEVIRVLIFLGCIMLVGIMMLFNLNVFLFWVVMVLNDVVVMCVLIFVESNVCNNVGDVKWCYLNVYL